ADGTEAVLPSGKSFCPAKGSVICIGELYGCLPDEENKGLNMSATNVAKMVAWVDARMSGKEVESPMDYQGECRIIPGICEKVEPGPADNAINNKNDEQVSLADKMAAQGVKWTASDKSPGSRAAGAALLCEMLEA